LKLFSEHSFTVSCLKVQRFILLRQNRHLESRQLAESNRITLMLLVVVGVFLLVELPLAAFLVTFIGEHTFSTELMEAEHRKLFGLVINLCILVSYPVNFIIYCTMSREFRNTCLRLLLLLLHQPCKPRQTVAATAARDLAVDVGEKDDRME
jgi:hypothetical protein